MFKCIYHTAWVEVKYSSANLNPAPATPIGPTAVTIEVILVRLLHTLFGLLHLAAVARSLILLQSAIITTVVLAMADNTYEYLPVNPTTLPATFNFATDIVDYWASKDSSQLALYWTDQSLSTTRKLTYSHFSKQSHRIAHLLTDLGLKSGDTIILILPRLPEWWAIATACLRAGIILCPCTTLLVEKDIEYRLQVSHASAFIGDDTSVAKCLAVRSNSHKLKQIIQVSTSSNVPSGVTDFHTALENQPTTPFSTPSTLTPTSPALTFFTSGTTGPPKIVLHTATSYPLAHALTGVHWLNLTPSHHPSGQSLYWNLSEQGWAKAAWSFFSTWNCGGCLFIHDDRGAFSAGRTLEVLHRFPITTLCAPPTVYRQLVLDENRKLFEGELKPKALKHACGAGEPLNEGVIKTWRGMSGGLEIRDGYGQTESILVCANMVGKEVRLGSMGLPVPGVPLRVVDGEGRELGPGKEGDIAIEVGGKEKGGFFGLYEGYVDKSSGKLDRRIRSFSANGGRMYYLTGDRATRDEDGYFWFVGRLDDVIVSLDDPACIFKTQTARSLISSLKS